MKCSVGILQTFCYKIDSLKTQNLIVILLWCQIIDAMDTILKVGLMENPENLFSEKYILITVQVLEIYLKHFENIYMVSMAYYMYS